MAAKDKETYIAHRTDRVGWGDLTVQLVAGEEVPPGLPQDVLDTLLENQSIYNVSGTPAIDVYSQDYRDLQTFEDSQEDKGK